MVRGQRPSDELRWELTFMQLFTNSVTKIDDLCSCIIELARMFIPAEGAGIMLYDPEKRVLSLKTHSAPELEGMRFVLPNSQGCAGWALTKNAVYIADDLRADDRYMPIPGDQRELDSLMCIPLIGGGERMGVLRLENRYPLDTTFSGDDAKVLGSLARAAAISLRQAIMIERLRWLATHDHMTGLTSRTAFIEAVVNLIHQTGFGPWAHMIYLDLDKFKRINDNLGHRRGDEIVHSIGRVVNGLLQDKPHMIACRWGGDEFLLFVLSYAREAGEELAEKLRRLMVNVVSADKDTKELGVGASAGLYTCSRGNATYDIMLDKAEEAMYHVKESGGGRLVALVGE